MSTTRSDVAARWVAPLFAVNFTLDGIFLTRHTFTTVVAFIDAAIFTLIGVLGWTAR